MQGIKLDIIAGEDQRQNQDHHHQKSQEKVYRNQDRNIVDNKTIRLHLNTTLSAIKTTATEPQITTAASELTSSKQTNNDQSCEERKIQEALEIQTSNKSSSHLITPSALAAATSEPVAVATPPTTTGPSRQGRVFTFEGTKLMKNDNRENTIERNEELIRYDNRVEGQKITTATAQLASNSLFSPWPSSSTMNCHRAPAQQQEHHGNNSFCRSNTSSGSRSRDGIYESNDGTGTSYFVLVDEDNNIINDSHLDWRPQYRHSHHQSAAPRRYRVISSKNVHHMNTATPSSSMTMAAPRFIRNYSSQQRNIAPLPSSSENPDWQCRGDTATLMTTATADWHPVLAVNSTSGGYSNSISNSSRQQQQQLQGGTRSGPRGSSAFRTVVLSDNYHRIRHHHNNHNIQRREMNDMGPTPREQCHIVVAASSSSGSVDVGNGSCGASFPTKRSPGNTNTNNQYGETNSSWTTSSIQGYHNRQRERSGGSEVMIISNRQQQKQEQHDPTAAAPDSTSAIRAGPLPRERQLPSHHHRPQNILTVHGDQNSENDNERKDVDNPNSSNCHHLSPTSSSIVSVSLPNETATHHRGSPPSYYRTPPNNTLAIASTDRAEKRRQQIDMLTSSSSDSSSPPPSLPTPAKVISSTKTATATAIVNMAANTSVPRSQSANIVISEEPETKRFKSGHSAAATSNSIPMKSPAADSSFFDKLDLLCSTTLDMGPLQDNPSGCSCPKSKCIALYCDCFKAGRRCSPGMCSCLNCKNTVDESGIDGARTRAIRSILARNPRAFATAGMGNPNGQVKLKQLPPDDVFCNCIRSKCLKLYCGCFQVGKVCNPDLCTCVKCANNERDDSGERRLAIQNCLEKRPNAFKIKTEKEVGMGCACKNNRCIRKYCECFRTDLTCSDKCTCHDCGNKESNSSSNDCKMNSSGDNKSSKNDSG